MKRALTAVLAVLLAALGAGRAAAFGSGDKGGSGAAFLKIGPGARPAGMGEAFAGVADDVHSVYYNPAGLANLKRVEAAAMHESRFQSVNYDFAAVSVPMLAWTESEKKRTRYGVAALSLYSLSVGGIERRSTVETDQPIDKFAASDFAYALSYAWRLPDSGLALGATAKFVDSKIDSARATSAAADVGGLYRRGRAAYGAGVRNVGTKHKFRAEADPLPLTIFAGAGAKLTERWIASVEVDAPRDASVGAAFGGEYKHPFAERLSGAVRAGFNTARRDGGGLSGVSLGLGLGYGNFNFDFAFVPQGDLGSVYKYSLVVKF